MTRRLALLMCVGALVAAACRTGVPVLDTGPKPPTQDGTIAGHVSTGGGTAAWGRGRGRVDSGANRDGRGPDDGPESELVDRTNELYSDHAILREGSA